MTSFYPLFFHFISLTCRPTIFHDLSSWTDPALSSQTGSTSASIKASSRGGAKVLVICAKLNLEQRHTGCFKDIGCVRRRSTKLHQTWRCKSRSHMRKRSPAWYLKKSRNIWRILCVKMQLWKVLGSPSHATNHAFQDTVPLEVDPTSVKPVPRVALSPS